MLSWKSLEFLNLFPDIDGVATVFVKRIKERAKADASKKTLTRNRRYAELLRLREQGNYFSNEKMREREPLLFDVMVGKYLDDKGKH